MKNNFFNIIIPTRNRLVTLQHSIKTVLNQNYDNYKIIVSDNYSNDGTKNFLESLNSEKIEYFNTGRSISMSSNYEFALSKIKEGFVILIGDDDGLLPFALKVLNEIINEEKALAISSCTAVYYWPGASPYEDLLLIPRTKKYVERRESSIFLEKLLNGSLDYSELPMLYTGGVVHSSLIDKAKNSAGKFYHSFTPDIYSGIAIASVLEEYIRIEEPLAISGLSKYSNGQSQLGSNKDDSIAQAFYSENDILFLPLLGDGKVKSLHLLILEAYIQSSFLRKKEAIDLTRQFEVVIAKSQPSLRKEILYYLKLNCNFNPSYLSKNQIRIFTLRWKFYIQIAFLKLNRFFELDAIFVRDKISNILEASVYIDKRPTGLLVYLFLRLEYVKAILKKKFNVF